MYKFREIQSERELEDFMHLRYKTYAESSNQDFLHKNEKQIDIDIYDLHSKHFGLFYKKDPIGSIRLVNHKSEIYDERAFNIGLKNGFFTEELHSKENLLNFDYPDFPFVSNSEIPNSISSFYKSITAQKDAILEGSRLVLTGRHRGLRLAKFLIECSIVYTIICTGKKHAILNCNSTHERFYKQYGFKTINDQKYYLKGRTSESDGSSSSLLSLSSIGQKFADQFHEMANEFTTSNKILRAI